MLNFFTLQPNRWRRRRLVTQQRVVVAGFDVVELLPHVDVHVDAVDDVVDDCLQPIVLEGEAARSIE